MRDYKKLETWRLADGFAVVIYRNTRSFPGDELYGLTSQIRRAAVSVAANIVEGSGRRSKKDYLRFLDIARGSLSEAQYSVHSACRLGYLHDDVAAELTAQGRRCFACLHRLIRAVEREAGGIAKYATAITTILALCTSYVVGHGRRFLASH